MHNWKKNRPAAFHIFIFYFLKLNFLLVNAAGYLIEFITKSIGFLKIAWSPCLPISIIIRVESSHIIIIIIIIIIFI